MSWEDLQALFSDQSQGVSAQNISSTNLALYMKLVLMKIASYYDWSFAIKTATVTLTGSAPFNLKTALPDMKRLITITGASGSTPYEWELIPTRDYQLTVDGDGDFMDLRNKSIYLRPGTESTLPSSVTVVYFSNFLVESSLGVRKITPSANDDVFVIPNEWEPILLDGLLIYLLRKEKKYAEVREMNKMFSDNLTEMALKEPAKVSDALRGFHHYGSYLQAQ